MKFIFFLVVFSAGFGYFSRDGIRRKFVFIALAFSLVMMFLIRISGGELLKTLGSGLNLFLMAYDVLAALAYKKPQSTPNMPERAEDVDGEAEQVLLEAEFEVVSETDAVEDTEATN